MTTTDEFMPPPARAATGPLTLSYAQGLQQQRAEAAHRRRLALIRHAAASFALGLAAALVMAWEVDRWLVDLHYAADPAAVYVLPEDSALTLDPEVAL